MGIEQGGQIYWACHSRLIAKCLHDSVHDKSQALLWVMQIVQIVALVKLWNLW